MAKALLTVDVARLPEVKALIASLVEERDALRDLLAAWEPRVICPQCGNRYAKPACGPTHALIMGMVKGVHSGGPNREGEAQA